MIKYMLFLIIGIVVGASVTIMFVESYYRKQIESINEELRGMEKNMPVPNITLPRVQ